jgi:uncharacterized protein YgbK (DUF1537 family)
MIGAIADDFTGATDVAVAFRRAGLRTAVLFGHPTDGSELPDIDAAVIGLKTRTIPVAEAVLQSVVAVQWLQHRGAAQIYFKYCSTFDSRPEGNIGPVTDALATLLQSHRVVLTPSSPEHGRTQYQGHLFVGDQLLSESPMRHHPLTPMTDSYIPRVLQQQTREKVALIARDTVHRGADAIAEALTRVHSDGVRYIVVDAIDDDELTEIGMAVADDIFVTGAAGLAGGLGRAIASIHPPRTGSDIDEDPVGPARSVVLAGSCSARTLLQIADISAAQPTHLLDALRTPDSAELTSIALEWYDSLPMDAAPLIYSSLPPEQLRHTQQALGTERASKLLETAMGRIAQGLVNRGVRRIVVAGGETSGAVVSALEVKGGVIGDEAAPGVPWIYTIDDEPIALLLKSGNFGDPGLLTRAVRAGIKADVPT